MRNMEAVEQSEARGAMWDRQGFVKFVFAAKESVMAKCGKLLQESAQDPPSIQRRWTLRRGIWADFAHAYIFWAVHVKRKLKVKLEREKAQTSSQLIQLTSSRFVFHKWLWWCSSLNLTCQVVWSSGSIIFYLCLGALGKCANADTAQQLSSAIVRTSLNQLGAASVVVSGKYA